MAQWYIKEFSKISNVSVRTLHHYDKIGLLKPSVRLPNGYRLYAETDLLRLQQIISLKFFGFELSEVQGLLNKESNALEHFLAQKQTIRNQITQLENADRTLERIIQDLKDNGSIHWNNIIQLIEDYRMTKETKMIWGPDLDSSKQQAYQKYMVDIGLATQAQIDECNLKAQSWSVDKINSIKDEQDKLLKVLAAAIDKHLQPADKDVQIQIRKHFESIKNFWTLDKEGYKKLAQYYCEHPDFDKFISSYHPKLTQFLAEAMMVFAERELS